MDNVCIPHSCSHWFINGRGYILQLLIFEKVWHNIEGLLDHSWMVTYALTGGVVWLILNVFKCLMQQIQHQQTITKVTLLVLTVLTALSLSSCSPPQYIIYAWLVVIQKRYCLVPQTWNLSSNECSSRDSSQ